MVMMWRIAAFHPIGILEHFADLDLVENLGCDGHIATHRSTILQTKLLLFLWHLGHA